MGVLVVLVRKKDRSLQFCIDYWGLNVVTQKDTYPLPRMDDVSSCYGEPSNFQHWIW